MTNSLTAPGEAVEAELDRLIERRAAQGDVEAEEALWMASVRRYEDKRRRETLWQKLRHHEAMLRSHSETYEYLIRRHRVEVERCEAMLGIDTKGAV